MIMMGFLPSGYFIQTYFADRFPLSVVRASRPTQFPPPPQQALQLGPFQRGGKAWVRRAYSASLWGRTASSLCSKKSAIGTLAIGNQHPYA